MLSTWAYVGVSKSFRTGGVERKLRMVKLSATRCSYIAILWVSLVSFVAIAICVASQRVFIDVSVYFVIDSIRKILDTYSCNVSIKRLGYGLNDRGATVRFPEGANNISLHYLVRNGSGALPASYPMFTGGIFAGVKRSARKADHSPQSSAEVKNAWSYTSTLPYVFMAWCLVKHRDFTFLLCQKTIIKIWFLLFRSLF
jgi:hypothetical protein